MSQRAIIAIIWSIIFIFIGAYFQKIGWSVLGYIFFILAVMSIYTLLVGKK
jgi:hypothetical protein